MSLEENKFYMAKLAEILQNTDGEAQSTTRQKFGLYSDDKEVVDLQHDFIQCSTSESPCFAVKNHPKQKVAKLNLNQFQTRYPLQNGPNRVSSAVNAEEEKVYLNDASYCKPERLVEASQDDS